MIRISAQVKFTYFQVLMAPPLYRHFPIWYRSGLVQVATRFSSVFSAAGVPNLSLLPSFSSQELMPDGKHLTPVSGLHYILHLFDPAEVAITASSLSGDVQFSQVKEQVRQHEDRMAFLENRQVNLDRVVDLKIAVDAEFNDSVLNRSEEDWFVVTGLPRLGQMSRHDFQGAVRKQITDIIRDAKPRLRKPT